MRTLYKIIFLSIFLVNHCVPFSITTLGIGPGAYNTENKLKNFIFDTPSQIKEDNTIATFKTKVAPFFALALSETITPHERCSINGLITGGVLPFGTGCFIDYDCVSTKKRTVPVTFSGHFFISAYGSCSIDFPIKNDLLQFFLGYGLNAEYLDIFLRGQRPLFSEFNRRFIGPFSGITYTYKKKAFSANFNYQLMIGNSHNDLLYKDKTTLALITPCIMNSISVTTAYAYKMVTFSCNASYSRINNYHTGNVSLCINRTTHATQSRVIHYFINSLAFYIQAAITF